MKGALALLGLAGLTGCLPVQLGAAGDETPLTGAVANLTPVGVRPAWRRVLNEGPVYRIKPRELATAAYSPDQNRLAVGSRGGYFTCFRASDGAELWRARLPGGVSSRAVFDGSRIIVGTDDGRLIAFDGRSGRELWSYRVQGAIAQPAAVDGDAIYFVDGTNSVYSVDRTTGAWRWQYRRGTPAEFAIVGEAPPTVDNGKVFVGFSDGHLVALSGRDGAVVWTRDLAPEHDRFQDVDAQAVVLGGKLYAASAAGGLYALEPSSGAVLWNAQHAGIVRLGRLYDDLVAGSDRGTVLRIRRDSGRIVWQTSFGSGAPTATDILGDHVVVGTSKGGLYFLDAVTGRPDQHFAPGFGVNAAAEVGADGSVFVVSNGGVLYAFSPGR